MRILREGHWDHAPCVAGERRRGSEGDTRKTLASAAGNALRSKWYLASLQIALPRWVGNSSRSSERLEDTRTKENCARAVEEASSYDRDEREFAGWPAEGVPLSRCGYV